ncbi:hypothetical protein NQ318_021357 [Aromia moschata]|uniref:Uncharacterized protein n=1 Tax=Aromia moschata TaxID=1265417 RepID=A0AAV8ZBQ0_9CUCU|nr:hypothetical protein NQ318_021357 [Aromia moschata]
MVRIFAGRLSVTPFIKTCLQPLSGANFQGGWVGDGISLLALNPPFAVGPASFKNLQPPTGAEPQGAGWRSVVAVLVCSAESPEEAEAQGREVGEFIGRMVEQGRTMVHHVVKRFQIILPAIFFKLGVAFTMLVLVALASVTNGFIGFLLLVVGLSSVLARLQESSRRPAAPYYLPAVHHHAALHHGWDRNDKNVEDKSEKMMTQAIAQAQPQYAYSPLSTYNPGYYGQN